jgi:hypothetical protein
MSQLLRCPILTKAPSNPHKQAKILVHLSLTILHILNPVNSDPLTQLILNIDASGVNHTSDHSTYQKEMMCVDLLNSAPLELQVNNTITLEETDSVPLQIAQENAITFDEESIAKISSMPKTNLGPFGWLMDNSLRKWKKHGLFW